MRRILLICMCFMACLSFGRGSVAHAMAPGFLAFVAGADRIVQHDGDPSCETACSPGHKGMPHHHSTCHGHKIGLLPLAEPLIFTSELAAAFAPTLLRLVPNARPDTATRPPNA